MQGRPAGSGDHGSELHSAFHELAQRHGPGLFALVTGPGGEVVFSGSAGTADLEQPHPITATDRFRIASVTKTYVAALALQLAADRVFALSDTVAELLPAPALLGADRITVEHLLRMRSGLPDYVRPVLGDPPDPARVRRWFDPRELVGIALAQPGRWAPGARWRYSNTDYVLLGMVIEAATGRPLAGLLRRRVLDPLGLRDTYLPGRELGLTPPHVRGYFRPDPASGFVDTTEFSPSESWAAGALVSTPVEVAAFLDALLGGQLLPAPALAAMRRTSPGPADLRYGMGLFRYRLRGGTVVHGHGGTHYGVDCYAFRSDAGRTVVLYRNSWDRATGGLPRQSRFLEAAF